jgi:hypothetical protein
MPAGWDMQGLVPRVLVETYIEEVKVVWFRRHATPVAESEPGPLPSNPCGSKPGSTSRGRKRDARPHRSGPLIRAALGTRVLTGQSATDTCLSDDRLSEVQRTTRRREDATTYLRHPPSSSRELTLRYQPHRHGCGWKPTTQPLARTRQALRRGLTSTEWEHAETGPHHKVTTRAAPDSRSNCRAVSPNGIGVSEGWICARSPSRRKVSRRTSRSAVTRTSINHTSHP